MTMGCKPDGYATVSPYLSVTGGRATIDFLITVFDAVVLREFADEDDKIMHAEVRIDDSIVMLGDANDGFPPAPCHVHVYVADVDATHQRALAAGAQSVQEPMKKADPDRRSGVKDAGGTTWWIATKVE
jgi:uncharacterized glyoxalase superfamily protein PhnB